MSREAISVCLPSESYARHADYFGMVSGRDVDKFAAIGLCQRQDKILIAVF